MKTLIEYWADLYNQQVFGESYLAEDKTAMIRKLVLPDIDDEGEKDKYKSLLIDFFKSHSNYENKIDWNKFKSLTKKDFDDLIQSAENSKSAQKKQIKSEIDSDIKNIFKSVGDRKFKIVGENDRWLFVAPLTYEAAVYCDSSINQGAGAKWCIGYNEENTYWKKYVREGSVFVMAFNKNYKNLSSTDKQSKLKFMIQRDDENKFHIWNQEDMDTGSDLNVFGNYEKIVENMFETAETELCKEQGIKRQRFVIGGKKFLFNDDSIHCSFCGLTSLEGAPSKVKGYFNCCGNDLTSLEGASSEVEGDFDCSNNKLTSLEGAPSEVGGYFTCSGNRLTSLEGAPSKVGGYFNCHCNQLTSLEGCPSEIGGKFICFYNKLTSLEGAPSKVGGKFDCSGNQLTSLEGAPSEVGGYFDCRNNQLTDEQVSAYKTFLKMSPEQQKASGLLDDTGHYNPKE